MTSRIVARIAVMVLAAVLPGVLLAAGTAHAQGKVSAHYAISMTGVTIGHITWTIDIGEINYSTTATGKASGVLSVLMNGDGTVNAQGRIAEDHLDPSAFTSTITDEDGTIKLTMTFANGVATENLTPQPPSHPDRTPLTDADRRDVADPLSAVLISTKLGGGTFAASDCDRTLRIFDGRRRYNLVLSNGRVSKVEIGQGYRGPVLVCSVVLEPVAGYRANSMIVKYVARRRNMELWFAPIAGTSVVAPVRVLMPTLVGTLKIEADRFEATAAPVTHAPVEAAPLPPPQ